MFQKLNILDLTALLKNYKKFQINQFQIFLKILKNFQKIFHFI
jgi:hypothetical protein